MFDLAAISTQNNPASQQNGRPGAVGDLPQGKGFAETLARLAYASLPIAIFAQTPQILDGTRATPFDGPIADDETGGTDAAAEYSDPREERVDATTLESLPTTTDETPSKPSEIAALPAAPGALPQEAAGASAPQGVDPPTPKAGPVPGPRSGESDAPPPQTGRQAPDLAAKPPTSRIVDGGAANQLPQAAHTLSSRAVEIAQSEPTKPALPTDGGLKNATGNPPTTTLVASAAQATGHGLQKAKGPAKAGGASVTNGVQNANVAPSAQVAAQQTPPSVASAAQLLQQNLANAQSGTGGTPTAPATLLARAEQFSLAGDGLATQQLGPRSSIPTVAPKPPSPVPARFVTNQVAVQIQKAFAQGGDRISIQLKPADLGRVEVRLDVGTDGRVTAVITADRADTLGMLQRDARILQNSLQDAGLQTDRDSLSFELKGQHHASDQSQNGSGGAESKDAIDADVNASAAPSGIVTDDRVDIQV